MNLFLRKSILFAMVLLTTAALNTQAQQTVEPPLITVTGQAEVNVVPDEVVFTLEVRKRDKDLLAAKEQNDQVVRSVMELARRYSIPPQNVQTDYISVEPKYRTENKCGVDGMMESKTIFDGYEVSKTVVIRLKDITRFEGLLSDILKSGVDRVRDVDFRTTAIRKYKDQARALAIRAAQEKAIALTKEIGQSVGKAYSIREQGYTYSDSNVASNSIATIEGGGDSDDETSTIAPGMIKISARVIVSFRLL